MTSLLSSSSARSSVRLRNAYTTPSSNFTPEIEIQSSRTSISGGSVFAARLPGPGSDATGTSGPIAASARKLRHGFVRLEDLPLEVGHEHQVGRVLDDDVRRESALLRGTVAVDVGGLGATQQLFGHRTSSVFLGKAGHASVHVHLLARNPPRNPAGRERLGSRRDATSPSRCRRDVDPGGPGARAPDLGLRRQRLRLERPRLRTSRVRRQPVRRRRRPLVESAPSRNRRDDRRRPRRARRHRRDHGRNLLMPNEEGLAELHTHLGGSVATEIMWTLAHEQGIALPVKDYWEFDELVTVPDARGVADLTALDQIYKWTELIQSSPLAVERSVHAAIGGAYRSQRITTLELRFNPMKRNRGGERDLDHIIMAAIRGLDRASLE